MNTHLRRSRPPMFARSWAYWLFACLIITLADPAARAVELTQADLDNKRCLNCHGQTRIGTLSPAERDTMVAPATASATTRPAARPGLYVPPEGLGGSMHGKLACTDCHTQAKTLPHPAPMAGPSCTTTCHQQQKSDYTHSAHAAAAAKGDKTAPTCVTCHGGHDIYRKADPRAKTFPLNIVQVCGDCHEKHRNGKASGKDGKVHIQNYLESVHGKAVASGLGAAATCADCHSHHRILPSNDPQSSVSRHNVPATCGQNDGSGRVCHYGLAETYENSIHGRLAAKDNPKAPVCSDCHTAHSITRKDDPAFMIDIVNECGSCHNKPANGSKGQLTLYESYRQSYHGQVNKLGFTRAARCSDCHGAHNIQRIEDPTSLLNSQNRINQCRKCHPGADAKFAAFAPHADFHDSAHYPILHGVWLYFVIMMSASFGFFGLHSLLWLIRSIIERIKHGPHPKHVAKGYAIKRFNRVDRVNHAFVIITFFGLALTGLPLLYSDKSWAQTLAAMLGGVKAAGIEHRVFAVMLIGNFVVHGVGVARRFKRLGIKAMLFGPTTMLPTKKDFFDMLGMFRWFFLGGKKPKFDRWTYWEKFDYTAEVGGSGIIGLSGLLLWFPVFFSAFVPGWMFNVATIVHGYEALLAVGFIFTIHFFNAHLRLEKFPVDDVMFTGRLPEEEFKEERGAEYERLAAQGELEALRVAPAPNWYRKFAVAMGIAAMTVGTTLVVLIILAALRFI